MLNLFIAFFMSNSEQFWDFFKCFYFSFEIFKGLGCCQALFVISARSLLISPIFPSLSSS